MDLEALAGLAEADPLKDIQNYSGEMTIAQVVRFFERQGVFFTKTMIQHYVRIGLLPPPVQKRFYSHGHLTMLVMIDSLKNVVSLDEIKTLFAAAMDGAQHHDIDFKKLTAIYKTFLSMKRLAVESIQTLEQLDASDAFHTVLWFMTCGLMAKQAAHVFIRPLQFPEENL